MRSIVLLCFIVLCVLLTVSSTDGQSKHPETAFVSLHTGAFISSLDGFKDTYGSNLGFAPGLDFGVQLVERVYICSNAIYFSKTGNWIWALPGLVRPGPLDFRQWILNAGVQYNLDQSALHSLDVTAGLTFTSVSQEFHYTFNSTPPDQPQSETHASNAFGYFGALSYERGFGSLPFTILGQVRYSFVQTTVLYVTGNYGGIDISAGLRYYFEL